MGKKRTERCCGLDTPYGYTVAQNLKDAGCTAVSYTHLKSLGDQLAAFLKIRFQMLLDFQKADGRDLLVGQRKGI